MKTIRRSYCPISSALDFFGDKWTLLIVRDLMFRQKNTFKDFLASEEKIATNILSDRLARLEAEGIISKSVHPECKAMNLYRLTPKGLDLMPVLMALIVWSDSYFEITPQGHQLAEKIRRDHDGIQKELTDRIVKRNEGFSK